MKQQIKYIFFVSQFLDFYVEMNYVCVTPTHYLCGFYVNDRPSLDANVDGLMRNC